MESFCRLRLKLKRAVEEEWSGALIIHHKSMDRHFPAVQTCLNMSNVYIFVGACVADVSCACKDLE